MKRLKRILALTLCVMLILSLGCKKQDSDLNDVTKQEVNTTDNSSENSTTKGSNSSNEETTTNQQASNGEETTTKGNSSSGEETTTANQGGFKEEPTTGNQSGSKEEPTTANQGNGNSGTTNTVTKPKSITVMWDDSLVTEDNGGREFVKALSSELGITVNMIRPGYTNYYDVLQTSFISTQTPDVFILSPEQYTKFASTGALWDMKNAWNNSELKKSGRFEQWSINMIASLETKVKNGAKGIYGFNLVRGNGCVTYVRTAWLEACGYPADGSSIKTYQDYYNMCVAFKNKYNVAPVTAARYMQYEAPYTHYLPEFYQDAYPDFIKKNGVWVDGFSEQSMKAALLRLQQANKDGLLDPDMYTNSAADARNGFYAEEHGVFTYWSGTWAQTIMDKLAAVGVQDTRITALKPIAELGKYVERQAPVVAIYSKAENPEGIFKYFIEPIYDGDKVQSLWTYGVKEIHWSQKGETITLNGKNYSYVNGEFHFLPNPSTKKSFMTKNHIDPLLAMGKFVNDPAKTAKTPFISQEAKKVMTMFNANSKMAPLEVSTNVIFDNDAAIWEARDKAIVDIIIYGKNVDEVMAEYKSSVGNRVKACLESLNGM